MNSDSGTKSEDIEKMIQNAPLSIVFPKPLPPNPTIGIIAPSSPAHLFFEEKYHFACNQLEQLGCKIIESKLIQQKSFQGYRTASAEARAREFMDMVHNEAVDVIMPVIGGMCSSSLLPYLDYEAIRASRKIIVGYSDITALHMGILAQAGLSTIYGPTLIPVFGEWPKSNSFAVQSFFSLARKQKRTIIPPLEYSNESPDWKSDAWKKRGRIYTKNDGWHVLREGKAHGQLLIANLNTLVPLLGTKYCPDFSERILLIEEMNAPLSNEERNLTSLKLHGVFSRIQALIVGKPEKLLLEGSLISYDEFLLEALGSYSFPIISNFDCGHTSPMISFFELQDLSLTAENGVVTITET
ncbi:S66 peptidase family protein [uncultured Sphaerochaeta sp.]|uniref:S66 family peptidase n=1 Tax=uncultured Sphaerochaeta sp. TaxID=886478 RepID=UPI003749B05A